MAGSNIGWLVGAGSRLVSSRANGGASASSAEERCRRAPHSMQNLCSGRTSVPQTWHCMRVEPMAPRPHGAGAGRRRPGTADRAPSSGASDEAQARLRGERCSRWSRPTTACVAGERGERHTDVDARSLRTVADRAAARRQPAHGADRLVVRPLRRGPLPAAHGGSRSRHGGAGARAGPTWRPGGDRRRLGR